MKQQLRIKYRSSNNQAMKQWNNLFRSIIPFSILGLFAYSVIAPVALAQSVRTMTITPPTIQVTMKPGTSSEGNLGIINDSDSPLTFHATVQDFTVEDTLGTPNILPPSTLSNKYSAASWIGVSPDTFTVQPHQRQNLNYYMQLPPDARPGGHYAAIVYTPVNTDTGKNQTGAVVNTEIGTLFYITVPGTITEYAQVSHFSANRFQEYGPESLALQIKNFGDLHITPKGSINVTDIFGRTIQSIPLDQHNIFPGAARDFSAIVGNKWMIGKFQANLIASYGFNNNLPLVATVTFWIFPWRVASVVVLIIVTIILGILLWKKRKKDMKENTEDLQTTQPVESAENS